MKPPKIAHDLYADLRDRKLLPLVVVLVLAMIAVPLLLKNDTEPPAPVDPAAAAAEVPEGIAAPAVLASDPGLRDYRERLEALHKSNPFASEAVKANLTESAIEDVSETTKAPGTPQAASSGGGGGTSSTSETITGSSTSETTTTETTVNVGGGSGGGSGDGGESDQGGRWFTYRVDVETGPAGDTNRRKNVKRMTVLPSRSNPIAVFLGVEEGGKRSIFMISDDVVDSRGDGTCLPDASACQFLTLREGDERKFEYAPSGEPDTFVLEIKEIRLVPADKPSGLDDRDARAEQDATTKALSAFLGL